jgi:hypothetical protein
VTSLSLLACSLSQLVTRFYFVDFFALFDVLIEDSIFYRSELVRK